MYNYITGIIKEIGTNFVVIENNNIGYQIYVGNPYVYRENLDAKITLDDAKSILNSKIEPISSQMAIIPTDSKGEVLTYEFKGKVNEREYLIYINANEKKEEKILIIMDTPGGILTM